LFFTDYIDPELKQAVSEGRKKEFADFGWDDVPDPEIDGTFHASRLTPREQWTERQQQIFACYRGLIRLRKEHPALQKPDKEAVKIKADPKRRLVVIERSGGGRRVTAYVNLGEEGTTIEPLPGPVIFNSEAPRYGGRVGSDSEGIERLLPGQFVMVETD
jgi:maltooligosyltrehalose trehalohydrolase